MKVADKNIMIFKNLLNLYYKTKYNICVPIDNYSTYM